MITLNLPLPPSANRYWRRGRNGVLYVSQEAHDYKTLVGFECRNRSLEPVDYRVALSIAAFMKYPNKGDLDNLIKVTLDALQGHLYINDSQVWKLVIERCYYKGQSGLIVSQDRYIVSGNKQ